MERTDEFLQYLKREEKAAATVTKYLRDVKAFLQYLGERELTRDEILEYKKKLCEGYAPRSVNAALASLNCFFRFLDRDDLRVKNLRIQRNIFAANEKELTKNDYEKLVQTAVEKKKERLSLLLRTIGSTGIRISELSCITVSAACRGGCRHSMQGEAQTDFLARIALQNAEGLREEKKN